MSSIVMEAEDIIALKNAELGAKDEQIDNLVAAIVSKDKRIAELEEQVARMTAVLDDVIGVARRREEAARQDIARQEAEAGL
jgi:CHASE3 domain sensor protein